MTEMPDYLALPLILGFLAVWFWAVKRGVIERHVWTVNALFLAAFWAASIYEVGLANLPWQMIGLGSATATIVTLWCVGGDSERRSSPSQHGVDEPPDMRRGSARLIGKPPLDGSGHHGPSRDVGHGGTRRKT